MRRRRIGRTSITWRRTRRGSVLVHPTTAHDARGGRRRCAQRSRRQRRRCGCRGAATALRLRADVRTGRPHHRRADLAICHIEIPVGRPGDSAGVYGRSPYGGNLLLAPHEIAAGISHAGTACSPAESAPEVFTVNRIRVAQLSYTTYSNTVWPSDGWALNRASSPERVAAAVLGVRAAGAEVVIVSLHLPKELLSDRFQPTGPWSPDSPS